MAPPEPIPVRYRDRWISARWYKDLDGTTGYLFQCPQCRRSGFIAVPPYKASVTIDRRLTLDGVIQCPRQGCNWKGTIMRGIVEDA